MSPHLHDLLQELADHETRAVVRRPVPASEARRMRAEIARRRARRLVGTGIGVAAAVVVGVVVANALGTTSPQPAVPEPGPTTSSSSTPTTSPAATAVPDADPGTTRAPRGLVAPLPAAPGKLWTVRTADLVTGWSSETPGAPYLGSISAWPQGGSYHTAATDDVWVVALGDAGDDHVVGLDPRTGHHLWDLPMYVEETDVFVVCGGTSPTGTLVCLSATDASARLLLLDPRTGTTTRELPLDVVPYSIGLDGDLAVVHGVDLEAGSATWQGVSTLTGDVVWSHVEPGLTADLPEGLDWESDTQVLDGRARLTGVGYDLEIDTATGVVISWTGSEPLAVDVDNRIGTTVFRSEASADDGTDRLRAFASEGGPELWGHDAAGARVVGVIGDAVVVRDDAHLSLRDATTGAARWSVPTGTPVAFDGDRLVVERGLPMSADTTLDAIDLADGAITWTVPLGGRAPVVIGGALVLNDVAAGTLSR
jgi:hypothetical protein